MYNDAIMCHCLLAMSLELWTLVSQNGQVCLNEHFYLMGSHVLYFHSHSHAHTQYAVNTLCNTLIHHSPGIYIYMYTNNANYNRKLIMCTRDTPVLTIYPDHIIMNITGKIPLMY